MINDYAFMDTVKQLVPEHFRRALRLSYRAAVRKERFSRQLDLDPDDTFIVSYPKSGNTWMRFLVSNLLHPEVDVDFLSVERTAPDLHKAVPRDLTNALEPRVFKSHKPYDPAYRRVIYVVRDPRDVLVSYYHFYRRIHPDLAQTLQIEEFARDFLDAKIDAFGSWGENVGSWLGAREGTDGFMVVRYEDLKADVVEELGKIADFLELDTTDEHLRLAAEASKADRMRTLERKQHQEAKGLKAAASSDIPFVRKARTGEGKEKLPIALQEQIQARWGDVMQRLGYL